jgi:glutathione peroxidase
MWIKIIGVVVVLLALTVVAFAYRYGFIMNPSPTEPPNVSSVYDFKMKNIDGSEVKLDAYKGKVLLIVNTASKCGLTPQYEALQAVYDKYKDKNFVILGFPANNFMGQEPGTDTEIKDFCTLKYKVSFPMFSKISVKGTDQHPLYTYLTNEKSNPGFSGDISWNFEKFLIGKDGKTLARFSPKVKPDDASVIEAIEKALK